MQSFQTGKMGVAEGVAVVFFLLMPRVFLSTVAQLVQEAGQIAWLILAINGVYPVIAALMLSAVVSRTQENFYGVCQRLLGKPVAFVVCMYYILALAASAGSLLRQYCENTVTTALPDADIEIIILLYLVTISGLCWLGAEAMARAGTILMPFIIVGLVFTLWALFPFYVFHHLSPWRGQGLDVAVRGGISESGLNIGMIAAFILWPAFQKGKTIKKVLMVALGFSVFLKIIYYVIYVVVFGTSVGAEKAMPFYEMARLIYINPYLQRLESLFIVEWCWIGVMAVGLNIYSALYLFCQLFHLPNIRPLIIPAVFMLGSISLLPGDLGAVLVFDRNLIHVSNLGIYVIPTVLFLFFKLKKRGESRNV